MVLLNKQLANQIKEAEITQDVRAQVVGYIVAAISLVAGLAWNDAIKSLIEYFVPLSQNTIWAKLSYAVVISIFVGIASFVLVRWTKKP